jgi:hypothetical protein
MTPGRYRGSRKLSGGAKITVDLTSIVGDEAISLGDGVWVPLQVRVTYDDPERPAVAECEFVLDAKTLKPSCTSVRLTAREGAEIASEDTRLPLPTIWRRTVDVLSNFTGGPDAPPGTRRSDYLEDHGQFVGHETAPTQADKRQFLRSRDALGRRQLSDEFLEEVATVYRDAVKNNKSPRAEVVAQLSPGAKLNTARNWIQLARKRGILGPAPTERKAGEREKR